MLNKEEKALLQKILAECPKPGVQYGIPVDDMDPDALERLVHLGLVVKKGFQPTTCCVTEKGRQYFRDQREESDARRRRNLSRGLWFVLGAAVTKTLDLCLPALLDVIQQRLLG